MPGEMKTQLLDTVKKMREHQYDFRTTPALFRWQYPEEPKVLFEMLISEEEEKV